MGMNFPVKWYDNSMGGIPRPGYGSTAGSTVPYLDAVLVDGFNTITLDSVVVSSNVATATRSAGNHGFVPYQVIEIAGATPAALNGQWRVIAVTSTTFTFATVGISDQTASGTITCKTPPLGWERVFSSGLKRVYRSPNTDHCARSFFRFDDNYSNACGPELVTYTSMTDVDTGTGSWDISWRTGVKHLHRSYDSRHFAVGDDKTFYGAWQSNLTNSFEICFAMGAFESYLANDTDNDFYMGLSFGTSGVYTTYYGWTPFTTLCTASYYIDGNSAMRSRALRDTNCVPRPVRWVNDYSGYGGPAYPEPFTNGLFVTPNLLREQGYGGEPIRGRIRGTYWVLQSQPFYCPIPGLDLDDVIGLEGRRCRILDLRMSNASGSQVNGRGLFDITGPWD